MVHSTTDMRKALGEDFKPFVFVFLEWRDLIQAKVEAIVKQNALLLRRPMHSVLSLE
jgi:hypothetical protein